MEYPEGTFLDYAAGVKAAVKVPVIAVGRLGDPVLAEAAVEDGKADFIALGRTMIAEPEWVVKLARGEPARRCLACNTCVDEMRGGARLGCVVNARAGREKLFATAQPPQGERIAVIGAGPAGLTYASLVADGNTVTVLERAAQPGGAFRYAGKAPLFQDVIANERSFARYIDELYRACLFRHVRFVFDTDVTRKPALLKDFDRIVIATGARYRFGLGGIATAALDSGAARWPMLRSLFAQPRFRDWLYYRARAGTAAMIRPLVNAGQKLVVIGDAAEAGKSKAAISSAFEAALLGG